MGNDIKCGCKCQHSSQDDEVSFPSGLGKNNNSTYKSFEKIIIEDTFPEIESKINNNIEHSDDDKINIEVHLRIIAIEKRKICLKSTKRRKKKKIISM